MTRSRHRKHRWRRPGNDQDRSKFRNYENVWLRDQARSQKNIILLLGFHHNDFISHCFFSYCHLQWLLFSPTKNNFSTTWTHRNTKIYILKIFFVDSIYSKIIDIIVKQNFFLYLKNKGLCVKPASR